MTLAKTRKSALRYPLLSVLLIQLALTSLLCATSGYAANSIMLCTAYGLKTIQLDQNGDPIPRDSQQAEFHKQCFHCSTGCGGLALLATEPQELITHPVITFIALAEPLHKGRYLTRGPPPRAPPLLA